jgi:FixJ family two-component response regulator/anti-sigma regulatory factor (Ser/Thr protein kinase)
VLENCLLAALIDSIVSEKRIQLRANANFNLEAHLQESYGLFARVNVSELKRVLSNLINNAAEAFSPSGGNIDVIIESDSKCSKIIIKDNGKGIPKHILDKLGQQGISHGKEGTQSGSGLGVYHAKKTVENFGGVFKIESQEGNGTAITLILNKVKAPDWFVEKLILFQNKVIVVTDDDNSVLEIWRQRLSHLQQEIGLKLITCSSGACLREWIARNKNEADGAMFLMDYELIGQNETGLDLVEELKISKQAILVSSRYEENIVRGRCEKMGVKLIPKAMAALVPIVLEQPKLKYDAILVDDDPLIEMMWQLGSKEKMKSVLCFNDESNFIKAASGIECDVPIYVDVNLANGVSGQDVAKRIHQLGFKNIHLATGYEASAVVRPEFITSVIGKDFPF